MKKYLMALALAPLLSGCLSMYVSAPLREGAICLKPEFDACYSTQAVVSKYSQASINHLQIDLYSGVTLISSKNIQNGALGNTVTISNLKIDTTYTIKASAYKAAGVAAADLISIPADSQVQVTVAFDDRPTLVGIPVKLIDTPFTGQATGSVAVTPGGYAAPAVASFLFNINTIAGNGGWGYGGDGLAATSSKLKGPYGVAFDSAGNLYIADTDDHRIRKVDKDTHFISTVAGDGTHSYGGDGGAATSAQLIPYGVACDSAGNLYIADSENHRIRKVDKDTHFITTVAGDGTAGYGGDGGLATSAQLKTPAAVAFDSAGNLYIADTENQRIRKVDKDTHFISTIAGDGITDCVGDGGLATSAELHHPCGLVFDNADNLYIADAYNHRIRKINKADGIINTVAGDGTNAYGGDGGLATSAKLGCPYGVAFDSVGNLYIADTNNYRIRKVDKDTHFISTVAGDGTGGSVGDGGLATSGQLNAPFGIASDSAGNLYIADYYNCRIRIVY